MLKEIDVENRSTKDIILEYLKLNRGREIPVSEISEKFNFKLNRISNAIKELEIQGDINIERRPIKKGKYTIISLKGDTITSFAHHERDLIVREDIIEPIQANQPFPYSEAINLVTSPNFNLEMFQKFITPYYHDYVELVTQILKPLLYQTGLLWEQGIFNVADEHVVSGRIEKFLINLINNEPLRSRGNKTIVLTPIEGENHTIALLALELLLKERGFHVVNLSRSIPVLSIVDYVKRMRNKPEWIFYSVTMSSFINNLRNDIKSIRNEIKNDLKIAVGGQGFNNIESDDFQDADKIIKTNEELEDFLNTI